MKTDIIRHYLLSNSTAVKILLPKRKSQHNIIYIYIYRERERKKDIYIYIHIYTLREMDGYTFLG